MLTSSSPSPTRPTATRTIRSTAMQSTARRRCTTGATATSSHHPTHLQHQHSRSTNMYIERNGVLGIEVDGRFIPAISGGTGAEIALLAVAAVGAASAAYGTYQSAENQKQTLKAQAKIREEDAAITRMAGEAAAARQRKKDAARLESF